ncbi:hypothetical protein [uncultured Brevundimonas sp.]|uniref:hypothetical protein n=1 Tax=uncultured Brevundimonas sp. TaxID=213418 RepID=UPI0025CECD33|nr:hypothetical protein [uncultured Brevundimonas sp.]
MSAPAKLPRTGLGRLVPFSNWRDGAFWLMILGLCASSISNEMGWIDDGERSLLFFSTLAVAFVIWALSPYLPALTVPPKLGPLDRLQAHDDI